MITRRSLGKQTAAGAAAALGMVGAAGAAMATSGQISGVSGGIKWVGRPAFKSNPDGYTTTLPFSLVEDIGIYAPNGQRLI